MIFKLILLSLGCIFLICTVSKIFTFCLLFSCSHIVFSVRIFRNYVIGHKCFFKCRAMELISERCIVSLLDGVVEVKPWTCYRCNQSTERPRRRDAPSCKGPASCESGSDSELPSQSARMIPINEVRGDPLEVNTAYATDDTSADESSEEEMVLPQRSARRKRPAPVRHLCDDEITGG